MPREDRLQIGNLCVFEGPLRGLLFVAADACQLVCDLIRPQHEIHTPGVNSTDRRVGKARTSRILGERDTASLPDCPDAEGLLGGPAGKDHPDRMISRLLSERNQQSISRAMDLLYSGYQADA